MTWNDLLYQLKEWEKTNPELLEGPAIFSLGEEGPQDSWEIDCVDPIHTASQLGNDILNNIPNDEGMIYSTFLIVGP